MGAVKTWLRVNAKAVVAFVTGFFLPALWAAINEPAAGFLPPASDTRGWLTLLGSALISALTVWAKSNQLTAGQVADGFVALPAHEQKAVVEAVGPGPNA